MALSIPPANADATIRNPGSTQPFTTQWYNFFNGGTGGSGGLTIGVTDGSDAAAGQVGEYRHTFVLTGAAVNLLNNTSAQIASLALTAGDWDLWGEIFFNITGATLTAAVGAINTAVTTTVVVPADGVDQTLIDGLTNPGNLSLNGLRTRISITLTTTYLLVARVFFAGGTVTGYGALRARRVR